MLLQLGSVDNELARSQDALHSSKALYSFCASLLSSALVRVILSLFLLKLRLALLRRSLALDPEEVLPRLWQACASLPTPVQQLLVSSVAHEQHVHRVVEQPRPVGSRHDLSALSLEALAASAVAAPEQHQTSLGQLQVLVMCDLPAPVDPDRGWPVHAVLT